MTSMRKYLLIFVMLGALALDGCRTYVPIVERSHDIDVRLRYDSVARDHVRIMFIKGDTVHTTDSVTIVQWKCRTDTIVRWKEKDVPVEVPPKDYTFCRACTGVLFLLVFLLVIGLVVGIAVRVLTRR